MDTSNVGNIILGLMFVVIGANGILKIKDVCQSWKRPQHSNSSDR